MIASAGTIAMCIVALFFLIICYMINLSTPKEVKLLDMLPNTDAEYMMQEMSGQGSNSRYGDFHRKYMAKYLQGDNKDKFARMLGIKPAQLEQDIFTAHMEDKITVEEIISMKLVGTIGSLVFGVLCALANFNLFLLCLAGLCYYLGCMYPNTLVVNKMKDRRDQIMIDLPNFIELTYSVLEAGSTIQDALSTIATRTTGPLAEEFMLVAARTKVSGKWKYEMEQMALRNNVEPLTDLVSDILIAYEKGTSIVNVLKDDAIQMRALKNSKIMERAKKTSTTLLIPMAIFCFLPMLVLILGPMLIQFMENF